MMKICRDNEEATEAEKTRIWKKRNAKTTRKKEFGERRMRKRRRKRETWTRRLRGRVTETGENIDEDKFQLRGVKMIERGVKYGRPLWGMIKRDGGDADAEAEAKAKAKAEADAETIKEKEEQEQAQEERLIEYSHGENFKEEKKKKGKLEKCEKEGKNAEKKN